MGDHVRPPGVSLFLACCLLLAPACSSGSSGSSSGSSADPCPIVAWWADASGSVSEPAGAPESLQEAQEIANSLPSGEGQIFLQLYSRHDLVSSDPAFADESSAFQSSYC